MSERSARWRVALAGAGGCLSIVATVPGGGITRTLAVVLALLMARRWPVALIAGGVLASMPLLLVGVLGAAQSLHRRGGRAAAAGLTGLSAAAVLLAGAHPPVPAVLPLITVVPALWVREPAEAWTAARVRLIVAAAAASLLITPPALTAFGRLGGWLDVRDSTFDRYPLARTAIVGAVVLVVGLCLAAVTGRWSLAGAATAATVQIGVSTPLALSVASLLPSPAARWTGALAGAAIGAVIAASRWRVAAAAALTVSAATALFITYEAAGGHPEKAIAQHRVLPALILLMLTIGAAVAVVGAITPVLAPRGALPAALGPLAGTLVLAGLFTTQVSFVRGRTPIGFTAEPVPHMVTAGYLLLVAAAAIAGLGVAHHITERWAERRRAELIRREAAAAERERLARPIHDGVLQVLALVQREGGERLAALAAEQEAALRNLLSGGSAGAAGTDLRAALIGLAGPVVEVATPVDPVELDRTGEVLAAVRAALDNVGRHAGPSARAWILLEDEGNAVRVTVRDDGAGFEESRLDEAARAGRLGVAQSMRGRISDLGGTTTIHSRPGQGTEVEFRVPRRAKQTAVRAPGRGITPR
ncbi:sensor histidine kinase [Actinoplanes sp. NPDC020271]|uniref:sensor histidine kinase n=1 Tax=Actinoplanes sp. NPDC020271 TaxID=3363896 RepID=UPI0037B13971